MKRHLCQRAGARHRCARFDHDIHDAQRRRRAAGLGKRGVSCDRRARQGQVRNRGAAASRSWPSRRSPLSTRSSTRKGTRAAAEAIPEVHLFAGRTGDRGEGPLPSARSGGRQKIRTPASQGASCFTIDEYSAAGGRRRRRTSTTTASSTRSTGSDPSSVSGTVTIGRSRRSVIPGLRDYARNDDSLALADRADPARRAVSQDRRTFVQRISSTSSTSRRVLHAFELSFGLSFAAALGEPGLRLTGRLGAGSLPLSRSAHCSTPSSTFRSRCRPLSPASR